MAGLLDGVVVPLVTPMSRPGVPSVSAAEPLLRAMADVGVHTADAAGQQRRRAAHPGRSGRGLRPRGDLALARPGRRRNRPRQRHRRRHRRGRRRAEDAAAAGADALVLSPPTYFRHRDDEVDRALCGDGPARPAGRGVQHAARATPLTPACVDALVGLPHVVGVKDSSGDMKLLRHMIADRRPPPVVLGVSQGDELRLAEALRAGADGITPGTANLAPTPGPRTGRRR